MSNDSPRTDAAIRSAVNNTDTTGTQTGNVVSETVARVLAELPHDLLARYSIGIALTDAEGYFRFVSPLFAGPLGYTPEEMREMHCFRTMPSDGIKEEMTYFVHFLLQGSTPPLQRTIVGKDGRTVACGMRHFILWRPNVTSLILTFFIELSALLIPESAHPSIQPPSHWSPELDEAIPNPLPLALYDAICERQALQLARLLEWEVLVPQQEGLAKPQLTLLRRRMSFLTLPGESGASTAAPPDVPSVAPASPITPSRALSPREQQIFAALGRGESLAAITRLLGVRRGTVSVYCTRIIDKLGLIDMQDLRRHALSEKLS